MVPILGFVTNAYFVAGTTYHSSFNMESSIKIIKFLESNSFFIDSKLLSIKEFGREQANNYTFIFLVIQCI